MEDIYNKVATELNLDVSIVKETYKSYWKTIRDLIQELPLKDDLSEEQFKELKVNFNITRLGKLCVSYDRYKGVKKKFNYFKENDKAKED